MLFSTWPHLYGFLEKGVLIYSDKTESTVAHGQAWGLLNKVTFGNDGNVLYLDCADGNRSLHTGQKSLNYKLKICVLLYVISTSIKLVLESM